MLNYFDFSATTPVTDNVAWQIYEAMKVFGNPSSKYDIGEESKKIIEDCRETVKNFVGLNKNGRVFFTSGATESNNWAIINAFNQGKKENKNKIITTQLEHPSVLETCKFLEKQGAKIEYVPLADNYTLDYTKLWEMIDNKTCLVSIVGVNSETGLKTDTSLIGAKCKEKEVPYHCDATQLASLYEIDMDKNNINYLSFSGHKFGTPKGIGCLCTQGIVLESFIHGGHQQDGLRAGTENVPYIKGLQQAILDREIIISNENKGKILWQKYFLLQEEIRKLEYDCIIINNNKYIEDNVVDICFSPTIMNVCFKNINGHSLQSLLSNQGYYISSGSACSLPEETSITLQALNIEKEYLNGSIRISLSTEITDEQIYNFAKVLNSCLRFLKCPKI